MNFNEDLNNLLGIQLSNEQEYQFKVYFEELVEYNKHTNLTRITEEKEVYYKHFFDSLSLTKTIDVRDQTTLCDMGSGAGFPSLPIKIVYPHLNITIIDSSNKRINFLNMLIDRLQINHVDLVCDRIENYATKHQQSFDVITARALGTLPLILELGIPMLKNNGHLIAYKSNQFKEEITMSKNALSKLSSKIHHIAEFSLPNQYGERTLINIVKDKHVTGYPRSYQNMLKKPL